MHPLEAPVKLYTGTDGKPLSNGYVYFGQPNQNPETAPVTVYWDAAGTIPAAQPLRTVNGYIVRAGAPANVYYTGAYSETVKDAAGALLFTDASRTTNPQNYLTSVTASQVIAGLGYVPANLGSPVFTGAVLVQIPTPNTFDGNSQFTLTLQNTSGNSFAAAMMQFLLPTYGLKMGLESDNAFSIGGFSQGSGVYRVRWDASGNQVTLGNVTAYSDLRFKEEIKPIENSIARTLMMRGFTYLDNRTGQRKIGSGAQEALRAGFGEAVGTDDDGNLSLAYGQLALALVIENTRELQGQIDSLRTELNELKGA